MQVKMFSIRLDDNSLEIDQHSLNDFLESVDFKKSAVQFVETEPPYWSVLVHYDEKSNKSDEGKTPSKPDAVLQNHALDEQQTEIFEKLRVWRKVQADKLGRPAFAVCFNSELTNVAISKPKSVDELRLIKGFSGSKADKFGKDMVELLNAM